MLKTMLQELCQKRQWALPQYTVARDGPDHSPLFRASVAVQGLTFDSPEPAARSSREAQNRAAKAALDRLAATPPPPSPAGSAGQVSSGISSSVQMQNDFQLVSARSKSSIMDLQRPKTPSLQVSRNKIDAAYTSDKDQKVLNSGILDNNSIRAASADKSHKNDREAGASTETVETHNDYANRSDTSLPERALVTNTKIQDLVDCTSCEDGVSSSSKFSPSSQIAEAKTSSMLRNRVIVYPQKPGLVLPEGATLLPFSDDKWVAVSLDFANSEGDISV